MRPLSKATYRTFILGLVWESASFVRLSFAYNLVMYFEKTPDYLGLFELSLEPD